MRKLNRSEKILLVVISSCTMIQVLCLTHGSPTHGSQLVNNELGKYALDFLGGVLSVIEYKFLTYIVQRT